MILSPTSQWRRGCSGSYWEIFSDWRCLKLECSNPFDSWYTDRQADKADRFLQFSLLASFIQGARLVQFRGTDSVGQIGSIWQQRDGSLWNPVNVRTDKKAEASIKWKLPLFWFQSGRLWRLTSYNQRSESSWLNQKLEMPRQQAKTRCQEERWSHKSFLSSAHKKNPSNWD